MAQVNIDPGYLLILMPESVWAINRLVQTLLADCKCPRLPHCLHQCVPALVACSRSSSAFITFAGMADSEAPTHPGPTKTSSFKQQQNISLNIDKPTDVPTPEEPPQVEVIQTPTAAQVEATFDKELKQLQNQK